MAPAQLSVHPVAVDLPLEPDAPGDSPHAHLEPLVANVEQRLGALADSLRERDVQAVELQAQELHRALDEAVEARADTLVLLHPLADSRRVLPLERHGELLHAHPDFQLVDS